MKNILARDKRAQSIFVGFMIFLAVLITTIALIPLFKSELGIARDSSHLDCGNSSISMWESATCIIVDFTFLYFIGTAIAVGAAYLWWRKSF